MVVVHTRVVIVNLSLGLEKEMEVEDKRRCHGLLRETDKGGCA